jgi:ATP-binding cassette subfamily B protein
MYQKYNEMTSGKTSVYISHRLASTRFCDRVIMIADGDIVEEGTHAELLKLGGKYASLFEVQRKYYKEGEDENEEN